MERLFPFLTKGSSTSLRVFERLSKTFWKSKYVTASLCSLKVPDFLGNTLSTNATLTHFHCHIYLSMCKLLSLWFAWYKDHHGVLTFPVSWSRLTSWWYTGFSLRTCVSFATSHFCGTETTLVDKTIVKNRHFVSNFLCNFSWILSGFSSLFQIILFLFYSLFYCLFILGHFFWFVVCWVLARALLWAYWQRWEKYFVGIFFSLFLVFFNCFSDFKECPLL